MTHALQRPAYYSWLRDWLVASVLLTRCAYCLEPNPNAWLLERTLKAGFPGSHSQAAAKTDTGDISLKLGYHWAFALFALNGKRIITYAGNEQGTNFRICVWDVKSGSIVGETTTAFVSPLLTAGQDADHSRIVCWDRQEKAHGFAYRVWDSLTLNNILRFKLDGRTERGSIGAVLCYSPKGNHIVSASGKNHDDFPTIWDAAVGTPIGVLRGHNRQVTFARYSSDGTRILTCSEDKTARLWDVATLQCLQVLAGHEKGVSSAAFAPDGKAIVTTCGGNIARIWKSASGELIRAVGRKDDHFLSAEFSPDGERILTSGLWSGALLWDVDSGKLIHEFNAESGIGAAFVKDGRTIITVNPASLNLWSVDSGKELLHLPYKSHPTSIGNFKTRLNPSHLYILSSRPDLIRQLCSPDGQRILTIGHRETDIFVWIRKPKP